MAKTPKKAKYVPENKTIGIQMNRLAATVATVLDPLVSSQLDELSTKREDWEGGKFAVMFNVTSNMDADTLASLPDPHDETGNNPAYYYVETFRDGKSTGWKKKYFYDQLALDLPSVIQMGKTVDQLKRSMLDPNKVYTGDIGDDIKNLALDYRVARIKKLEKRITSAKTNVSGAFELRAQMLAFESLKHVECYPIYAIGKDGLPMNGEDGRGLEIEPTLTPIVIKSTVKGREDIDKVHVSIGTFLKYDVETAKGNGGTYQAVMNTAKREQPDDEQGNQNEGNKSVPQNVTTNDIMVARLVDQASFIDKVWSEKTKALDEAFGKLVHGAGSDDAFTAARTVFEFLKTHVGSPKDDARWLEYINEDSEHPLHKAA